MLNRSTDFVLALLLLGLLAFQASSLFVFPVPDSIRWFGDESWLMTESIATIETGTVHHPHALSSTLHAPKAFLPVGAAWIRTALYGLPGYLLFPEMNPVLVGRVVTWILSLLMAGLVLWFVTRRTGKAANGLIAALALVSTASYFFSSHSARPDLLKGLIILGISAYISTDRFRNAPDMKWFGATLVSLLSAIWLPFHLYFHLIAICGLAFMMYRGFKQPQAWMWIGAGIVASLLATALLQFVFSGELLLSGPEGHKAEFSDVTRDIPVLRLFSLSAQLSVLTRRLELLWLEAPLMFALLPAAGYLLWHKRSQLLADPDLRLLSFGFASLFVWYFLQRIHPAYTIQMLPLFIASSVCVISGAVLSRPLKWVGTLAVMIAVILSAWQAYAGGVNGRLWSVSGHKAIAELRDSISPASGKPMVMVEAFATMPLLNDTSIKLMTTHFQFFPIREESIAETISRHEVEYGILFNTSRYGYDRNAIDPLVRTMQQHGKLVAYRAGDFFDIGKEYFSLDDGARDDAKSDTLFLYRIDK